MVEAICPNCGHELIEDESCDIFVYISECQEYIVGHCENCGKKYQWVNIYKLSHVEDLKEC